MDYAARPGRLSNLLFWVMWGSVRLCLRVFFRFRIEGSLPASGSFVLVANHASFIDPIVLCSAVRRRIVCLMTEVVYRSRGMGWFYRWNKAIPLSTRSPNRESLRAARTVLQQGRVVGVYPEGGISRDGLPMLGNPGAVSLVFNEGVPIIPVGIVGTHDVLPAGGRWPRLRRLTIRFGEPLLPEQLKGLGRGRREQLQGATRLIMTRIAELTGQEPRERVLEAMRSG